ncbi:AAA family ATPase [Roseicella aquatilis]|uniref:ATP-binding protein n=1 Tax=Roseicella aquatilis TaxID=2527868 RepID=A0A4R4DUN3_9PROT|nr:ATP-binding protein [Roseicella aquatilis]TCZ64023.1 ATP-binding protein [Roseicella aquatilis]
MIDRFTLSKFKQIEHASLSLGPINVLVGGNNSGKSCVLQGIHFGIALAQARENAKVEQFPPERLLYCPTDDFLDLHHVRRLTEGTSIDFRYESGEAADKNFASIKLQRGRNGVVRVQSDGGDLLRSVKDPRGFFSIYVPGLAGITIREEYRSEAVLSNGIARGDANLYLRNVLLRIERSEVRKKKFSEYLDRVFPGVRVQTQFQEAVDLWIKSTVAREGGESRALDMVGTGLLQAIQLLAYVSNYEPKVLLLDEPDAHLHPSNQRLLADTLLLISEKTETKIILATHSRHLLDALSENNSARLFWVKNGAATPQTNWSDIAVLMDLGALDKGERFLAGDYEYLVWSEDRNTEALSVLLEANGVAREKALIFSYQASSKVDAAKLMAAFAERVRPGVKTIVHRDRDFMNDDEVVRLQAKYALEQTPNLRLFVTRGSDVEAYFCDPEHLAHVTGKPVDEMRTLVESVVQEEMISFVLNFREKREEIKRDLYKKDPDACPATDTLVAGNQIPIEKAVGKLLLKKVRGRLQADGMNGGAIITSSSALSDPDVVAAFA